MNPTSAVTMSLLIILGSGILQFAFAANRLRSFRFESGRFSRQDAVNNCTNTQESLFTVYDKEDTEVLRHLVSKYKPSVWLGLKKRNHSLTWSNGKPVTFHNSTVVIDDTEQFCEAIKNGTWSGFNCSDKNYFMCQNGSEYIPFEMEKNWCQALQHCRNHLMELASIDNHRENEELKNRSQNSYFWIGLMHALWEWDDHTCSTFRTIKEIQPGANCTIYTESESVMRYDCASEVSALCSKGTVRIQIVNQTLTWENALQYCEEHHSRLLWIEDQDDQNAVKNWLKNYTDSSEKKFWIGLRQSIVFGFWIWSDRIVNYTNWKNGTMPELPLSNHCGVINGDDFKWSDENCFYTLPFLCEEDIVNMKSES